MLFVYFRHLFYQLIKHFDFPILSYLDHTHVAHYEDIA